MPPALCCFDGLFAQTAVVWQNRHRIAANWARLAVPSGFRVPAEVPPMMLPSASEEPEPPLEASTKEAVAVMEPSFSAKKDSRLPIRAV